MASVNPADSNDDADGTMQAYNAQILQQNAMMHGLMGIPPNNGIQTTQPPAPPTVAPTWLDILQQGGLPRSQPSTGVIRQINPGVSWGGKDVNVMSPIDVQRTRVYGQTYDGL
jgi:hypothetical protein